MIVVVDYHTCNIGSIRNMLSRLEVEARVAQDASAIADAEKIILPGIGSFDAGMTNLEKMGLIEPLTRKVLEERVPILGICLGAQLMLEGSEEGERVGLGWISGRVKKFSFAPGEAKLKVPHMGWNHVAPRSEHQLFRSYVRPPRFYFVHSYYIECQQQENVIGSTSYGINFASAIGKDNIFGVQFHPEKSHHFGMQLLKNFIEIH